MSAGPQNTTEWKKHKFNKKKRGGAKNAKNNVSEAAGPNFDQKTELRQTNEGGPSAQAAVNAPQKKPRPPNLDQHELNKQMYRQAQNKRQGEVQSPNSPVPLPLFECLYCVGIHEHLALQTSKEKSLTVKYGSLGANLKEQAKKSNQKQFEKFNDSQDECDFYEEMDVLTQLLTINTMASDATDKLLKRDIKQFGPEMPINKMNIEDGRSLESSPLEKLRVLSVQNQKDNFHLLDPQVQAIK